MLHSMHGATDPRTWGTYPSDLSLQNRGTSEKLCIAPHDSGYFSTKNIETRPEKESIIRTAIEQSQISPTGSLNSVGSVENSNGESLDDISTYPSR